MKSDFSEELRAGTASLPKQSTEADFDHNHRRIIRQAELELVIPLLKPGARILEIGAGAGWQAKELANHGFEVHAIDLASSNYTALREWDVIEYDGHSIPLPDQCVDVVFSSNVLEHVPHIQEFQEEIRRVLVSGGMAVHIMPTATWRFWTSITFYLKRLVKFVTRGKAAKTSDSSPTSNSNTKVLRNLRRALLPSCHGVRGNVLTETYFFSESYWSTLFQQTNWRVQAVIPNGLFYSGNRIFGARLSLQARRILSRILGSSCKAYVLRNIKRSYVDLSPEIEEDKEKYSHALFNR